VTNFFFIDLDGTLEDSRGDMTDAVHRVRKALSLPAWADEKITPNVNRGMTDLYLACFADFLESEEKRGMERAETIERVRLAYEADYGANISVRTRLYEGMKETLEELARRGKVVCVTNKPEHLSRKLLKELGVEDSFTDVMGGDSCAECKPSSLPLRVAAQRHDFDSKQHRAFMIGDSAGDVACGREFGAQVVWCAYGYATTPGSVAPDFTANTPREILECVR